MCYSPSLISSAVKFNIESNTIQYNTIKFNTIQSVRTRSPPSPLGVGRRLWHVIVHFGIGNSWHAGDVI